VDEISPFLSSADLWVRMFLIAPHFLSAYATAFQIAKTAASPQAAQPLTTNAFLIHLVDALLPPMERPA
jgi:hypothetical protein